MTPTTTPQTHDRDAADPTALARALDAWLLGTGSADERDVAFESVLLQQGVLSPDDAVELFSTVVSGPEIRGVCVVLEGRTTMLAITRGGRVFCTGDTGATEATEATGA